MTTRLASGFPVVAIGASAGGVEALWALLAALPAELPAAVVVVLHVPAHSESTLDRVLRMRAALPVIMVNEAEPLRVGRIHVPRADRHLMVDGDMVLCTRGPKECRARPSVNVLFRSVSESCGERGIGVVLSGALDDGTAGAWAIKERGGRVFVQEPTEALHESMPRSVLEHTVGDGVAPAARLAAFVAAAVETATALAASVAGGLGLESRIAAGQVVQENAVFALGKASRYACPECHGVLTTIEEGRIVRFRCHTGHAYSSQTLLSDLTDSVDESLWNAVRALEEKLTLLEQLSAAASDLRIGAETALVRHRLAVLRPLLLSSSEPSLVASAT